MAGITVTVINLNVPPARNVSNKKTTTQQQQDIRQTNIKHENHHAYPSARPASISRKIIENILLFPWISFHPQRSGHICDILASLLRPRNQQPHQVTSPSPGFPDLHVPRGSYLRLRSIVHLLSAIASDFRSLEARRVSVSQCSEFPFPALRDSITPCSHNYIM